MFAASPFNRASTRIEDSSTTRFQALFPLRSLVLAAFLLASFNVRRRTRQIGTRRALGATRSDILKYFLAENAMLTSIGLMIGVVLTFALNVVLAEQFNVARIPGIWLVLGIVALLALGQLAVLGPAWTATRIPPAVATRRV